MDWIREALMECTHLWNPNTNVTSKCTGDPKMCANEKSRCPGSPQVTTPECPDPCPAVPRGKLAKLDIIEATGLSWAVDAMLGPGGPGLDTSAEWLDLLHECRFFFKFTWVMNLLPRDRSSISDIPHLTHVANPHARLVPPVSSARLTTRVALPKLKQGFF